MNMQQLLDQQADLKRRLAELESSPFYQREQVRLERYARFFPCFDQRPIKSGEEQQGAPAPLKVFFNFGEIVEVILHGASLRSTQSRFFDPTETRSPSASRCLRAAVFRS